MTFETGSRPWARKSLEQLPFRQGFLGLLTAHRHRRVLRRRVHFLVFISRAAWGRRRWVSEEVDREALRPQALIV